jgi:hypothetical protein
MFTPSLMAHVFGAFLLMFAIVLFIINYSKINDPFKHIVLALLFSAVITIHAISHLGLESIYGYNPLSLYTNNLKN